MKKTEQIIIRVTKEDKYLYKELANHMNISETIRNHIKDLSNAVNDVIPYKENPIIQYQLQEICKCRQDIVYFAEKYFTIISLQGKHIIKLYPKQKELLKLMVREDRIVCTKSRQVGASICVKIFALWKSIFHPNESFTVLKNKNVTACNFINNIRYAIDHLPNWLYPKLVTNNKQDIQFANDSRIVADLWSIDTIYSYDFNNFILLENAFYPDKNMRERWACSYPLIASRKNTKCFMLSTPNGSDNLFHDIYHNAVFGMDRSVSREYWTPFRIEWWDVPNRDEAWKQNQIKALGIETFNREFGNSFC